MNPRTSSILTCVVAAGTLAFGAPPEAPKPPARSAPPAEASRSAAAAPAAEPDAPVWLGMIFGDALDGGVQVLAVVPGGPADVAGVRDGDVLLAFGERAIPDRSALVGVVRTLRPNEEVSVRLVRQGRSTRAALLPLPPRRKVYVPMPGIELLPPGIIDVDRGEFAGCETTRITRDLRLHFGAPADAGVLVVRVDGGSAAAKAGLAVGDVVVKMAEHPIEDPDDMLRIIVRADSGAIPIEVVRARKKVLLRIEKVGPDAAQLDAERARLEAEKARLRRELERVQIEIETLRKQQR